MEQINNIVFNEIALPDYPGPVEDMTHVIRTDAHHATHSIKENLQHHKPFYDQARTMVARYENTLPEPGQNCANPPTPATTFLDFQKFGQNKDYNVQVTYDNYEENLNQIKSEIHDAYKTWVREATTAIITSERRVTYNTYETQPYVGIYDGRDLEKIALKNAQDLCNDYSKTNINAPEVYVTLDSQIGTGNKPGMEIAFSRAFDLDGTQKPDYVARPGHQPIEQQIAALKQKLDSLNPQGTAINMVFLEDNVRHARMLNWVIGRMEEYNIFQNVKLCGISTCFSSASPEEQAKIQQNGNLVPVKSVIDFKNSKTEVITPRDLMFDGFVIDTTEKSMRLPGIFMDPGKRFNIHNDKLVEFQRNVLYSNIHFCKQIEEKFGVDMPLSWLPSGDAIAMVRSVPLETSVVSVMRDRLRELDMNPR